MTVSKDGKTTIYKVGKPKKKGKKSRTDQAEKSVEIEEKKEEGLDYGSEK